jgi:hypothetical protein
VATTRDDIGQLGGRGVFEGGTRVSNFLKCTNEEVTEQREALGRIVQHELQHGNPRGCEPEKYPLADTRHARHIQQSWHGLCLSAPEVIKI